MTTVRFDGREGTMRIARHAVLCLVAAGAVVVPASQAAAQVPTPTVELVPDDAGLQGHPMWDSWFDLEPFGYEQHEYLVSGTATETNGTATAGYTTRIIVAHPSDPADFSGTVLLDWVNVTAQFENAVNTLASIQFLLREGWAFVHVSAQEAGICCVPGLTPKAWDPLRYAALDHPGDQFANDMFSQVAQAFKEPGRVNPLGELTTEVVIAAGQSQGAFRLSDYVLTTQASAGVIDGFLIQALGTKQYPTNPGAPVLHLLGDREGTPDEPTPWPNYRLWELAAAGHSDAWIGRQQVEGQGPRLAGLGQASQGTAEALWESAGNFGEQLDPRSAVCIVNGVQFPTRYVANAALWHLDNWVRHGDAPDDGPRYEFTGSGLARDQHGNTLGGIRLAPIVHPVATYLSDLCDLGGVTVPFTDAQVVNLYGDHATWYAGMVEVTEDNVADGFLLEADALDLLRRACNARNRFGDASTSPCLPAPSFAEGAVVVPDLDDVGPIPQPGDRPTPVTGGGLAAAGAVMLAVGCRRTARGHERAHPQVEG